MRVEFAALARIELDEARDWYEDQLPGLGERFRLAVRDAVVRIGRDPLAWPEETDAAPVRKHLLNRFPYKLLYAVEGDRVIVLAVAHQHRRPRYWAGRAAD